MARPKRKRRTGGGSATPAASKDWLPLTAFLGLMAGFLIAYMGAEVALYLRPHPMHWLVAAIGGGVGYIGGLVWNRYSVR